jgi:two-component system nitrogen regulation response regulator NtrX
VLESELFGHERGAFTGAVRQRPGRFELADGGTLLLDEIGAADAKVQLRLLRVLQEHEFERVGGTETLRVDVRVVAATNVDLRVEVREGRFREDLYYRLSVVPVRVPALRERRDDIPLLVEHFLTESVARNGSPVRGIAVPAVERLQAYPWPGNVRQLENVVEQMVVLAVGEHLTVADLPAEIADWREQRECPAAAPASFREARAVFERRYLCEALRRHRGVIAQVADAIGMSRKNLYMKLDSLEIDYDRFRG